MKAPAPVHLRASIGNRLETTAFFRNRRFFGVPLDEVAGPEVRVQVHAASTGAEVNSLAIALLRDPRFRDRAFRIDATDIEPAFVKFAGAGRYPLEIPGGLEARERIGRYKTGLLGRKRASLAPDQGRLAAARP